MASGASRAESTKAACKIAQSPCAPRGEKYQPNFELGEHSLVADAQSCAVNLHLMKSLEEASIPSHDHIQQKCSCSSSHCCFTVFVGRKLCHTDIRAPKDGHGQVTYMNGSKYEGQFHNHLRHGKGGPLSSLAICRQTPTQNWKGRSMSRVGSQRQSWFWKSDVHGQCLGCKRKRSPKLLALGVAHYWAAAGQSGGELGFMGFWDGEHLFMPEVPSHSLMEQDMRVNGGTMNDMAQARNSAPMAQPSQARQWMFHPEHSCTSAKISTTETRVGRVGCCQQALHNPCVAHVSSVAPVLFRI
eukprot:3059930-Amphidinium_carterae.1